MARKEGLALAASRTGLILIAAGIAILAAATLILALVSVTKTDTQVAYTKLGLGGVTALQAVVPEGASSPVLGIVFSVDEDATSGLVARVVSGDAVLATINAQPGDKANATVALPGPGKYTVTIEASGISSSGAVALVTTYKVPALYTEASSALAPAGSLAGFLAGLGVMYVRLSRKSEESRRAETRSEGGTGNGEEGSSVHGQGS